jgi:hypothetical protein
MCKSCAATGTIVCNTCLIRREFVPITYSTSTGRVNVYENKDQA